MFFTQEDYRKIQDWLSRNSSKDSELLEATPLNGNEIISIVQANHNKKISIKDFVNQIFKVGSPDFFNITDKLEAPYITLEEAISMLPTKAKKQGQVITFLNKEGNWDVYQFIGANNQCNIPDKWNNIFDIDKYIIDSLLPDEEDLTKTKPDAKGNSYVSLKDRAYNPSQFSGYGEKILRKHIIEVEVLGLGIVEKNILYQDVFDSPNTIYKIRYDFDLNGQTIELPENCILDFVGGSIDNGTLVLNDTLVYPFGCVEKEVIKCETEGAYKAGQMFFDREQGYFLIWDGENWKTKVAYRVIDNKLNESLDGGVTWTPVSDYIAAYFRWSPNNTIQISRNNRDWDDLSEPLADNVYIKGYYNSVSQLPSDALIGDIYMVGTGAPYNMYINTSEGWKNNGPFTSITAGIEQTTGQSTTNVMSQKAVTDKFTELESNISVIDNGITIESAVAYTNYPYYIIVGREYQIQPINGFQAVLTTVDSNGNEVQALGATDGYNKKIFVASANASYIRVNYIAVPGGFEIIDKFSISKRIDALDEMLSLFESESNETIANIETNIGNELTVEKTGLFEYRLEEGKKYTLSRKGQGEVTLSDSDGVQFLRLSYLAESIDFIPAKNYDKVQIYYVAPEVISVSLIQTNSIINRLGEIENYISDKESIVNPNHIIISGTSLLSQEMVNQWDGKVVEIVGELILQGNENIVLPQNSHLYFNGGYVSSKQYQGILYPNGAYISAEPYRIFENNISLGIIDEALDKTISTGLQQVRLVAGKKYRITTNIDGAWIIRYGVNVGQSDMPILKTGNYANMPYEFVAKFTCDSVYMYSPISGLTAHIESLDSNKKGFTADVAYAEWFGAMGDGVSMDAQFFNKLNDSVDSEIHLVPEKNYALECSFVSNNRIVGAKGARLSRYGMFGEVPIGTINGIVANQEGNLVFYIDKSDDSYDATSYERMMVGMGVCITATDKTSMYNFDQRTNRKILSKTGTTIVVDGGDLQIQGNSNSRFSLVTQYPLVKLLKGASMINTELYGGYDIIPLDRAHWWFGMTVECGHQGGDEDTQEVSHCYIHDNVADGIVVCGYNALIQHNRIEHSGSNGIHMGELNQCTITDNYIFDSNLNNGDESDSTNGVGHNDGAISFSNHVTNVIITRNLLDNCKVGIASIDTADDCKAIMTENTIISFRKHGIDAWAVATDAFGTQYKDYIVANNRILNGQSDIADWEKLYQKKPYKTRTVAKGQGIRFWKWESNPGKWENVSITGNLLRECGILVSVAENAHINSNNIRQTASYSAATAGANTLIMLKESNVVVNGNTIYEKSNAISTLISASAGNVILSNNMLVKKNATITLSKTNDSNVIENANMEVVA